MNLDPAVKSIGSEIASLTQSTTAIGDNTVELWGCNFLHLDNGHTAIDPRSTSY